MAVPAWRELLVGVEKALQLEAVVADIGHVEQGVLRQLPLHAEEVVFDVAVGRVLRNPGDVVGGRIEGGDQARRESLIGGSVAAGRGGTDRDDLRWKRSAAVIGGGRSDLRNRGELGLRSVDARDIARSCTGVVYVAGAEAAADRRIRRDGIGETNTRREVVQSLD